MTDFVDLQTRIRARLDGIRDAVRQQQQSLPIHDQQMRDVQSRPFSICHVSKPTSCPITQTVAISSSLQVKSSGCVRDDRRFCILIASVMVAVAIVSVVWKYHRQRHRALTLSLLGRKLMRLKGHKGFDEENVDGDVISSDDDDRPRQTQHPHKHHHIKDEGASDDEQVSEASDDEESN